MTTPIRIVCDENIAETAALLALGADITPMPGRAITREHLTEADALMVRSVTRVDAALIEDTPIRFVGTATAGVDHIDVEALTTRGIEVCNAPGSNANAVVEWVLTAIAHTGELERLMAGHTLGIVGLGHVGARLAGRVESLGGRVVAYDPLRQQWPPHVLRVTLDEVLEQDIVTLHAALHQQGPYPSYHLVQAENLPARKPRLLLNAGRGPLITREALIELQQSGTTLALDTWPDEPLIDAELLAATAIATPHIAGYSEDAKRHATDMLVRALVQTLRLPTAAQSYTAPVAYTAGLNTTGETPSAAVASWLQQHYPIERDDRVLRNSGDVVGIAAVDFDRMRRDYPLRSELAGRTVRLGPHQLHLRTLAEALGLRPVLTGA